MNIFLLAWNLPETLTSVALTKLRQMVEVYPQLEPDTLWHYQSGNIAFAASIHTANQVAAPRIYVSESPDHFTFYSGTIVEKQGKWNAWEATELSLNWQQLPQTLDGQFAVARLSKQLPSLELITDFLGLHQVYYLQQGTMWLVSNSVRLITQISEVNALDPLGISLFSIMGWVGSDRTLRQDVRVIPGGQYWKWQGNDTEPHRQSYFQFSQLSQQSQQKLTRSDTERIAENLTAMCRNLAQITGKLRCPLTGGRDSRLLACLLIHGDISADYYTDGLPTSADVQIPSQIANVFHLPYEVNVITNKEVIAAWETASQRLIQQNDGMVSFWQINDVLKQPSNIDKLGMMLSGVGGGIARGNFRTARLLLGSGAFHGDDIKKLLTAKLICNHGGLIQSEAIELAKAYLHSFVEQQIEDGFAPLDVLDIFHTFERLRRWGGINITRVLPSSDIFLPLCTYPFVEAAFAIPPIVRYTEPLHYQLMEFLVPQLHHFPFGKEPWRSRQPLINLLQRSQTVILEKIGYKSRKYTKELAFDRDLWLEANNMQLLSNLRQFCLDRSDSVIWNVINRDVFEQMTSPDVELAQLRKKHLSGLYAVTTLFYYAFT